MEHRWKDGADSGAHCQALDVACLQAYKSALFVERQDNNGTLRTKEWFNVLGRLTKYFWRGRNWKAAFHAVGLLGKHTAISEEIRQLGLRRVTDSPAVMPSEIQLQEIWPRRKTIPFKSLFWLPAKLKPDEIDWMKTQSRSKLYVIYTFIFLIWLSHQFIKQ